MQVYAKVAVYWNAECGSGGHSTNTRISMATAEFQEFTDNLP